MPLLKPKKSSGKYGKSNTGLTSAGAQIALFSCMYSLIEMGTRQQVDEKISTEGILMQPAR